MAEGIRRIGSRYAEKRDVSGPSALVTSMTRWIIDTYKECERFDISLKEVMDTWIATNGDAEPRRTGAFPPLCACDFAIEWPRHGVEVGGLVAHDEGDVGAARRRHGLGGAQESVQPLDVYRRLLRFPGAPHAS